MMRVNIRFKKCRKGFENSLVTKAEAEKFAADKALASFQRGPYIPPDASLYFKGNEEKEIQ